jgi:transposase-like protein
MARKGKSAEEIISFLREAEVRLAQGHTVGKVCRSKGITEQTYDRWRREYGGLKMDQAKRLKELERENDRLKKAVCELNLDKLILKEALSGKY